MLIEMHRNTSTFKWITPIFLVVFSIIAVPIQIMDEHGLPRFQALQKEKNKLIQKNKQILIENSKLQMEIENLKNQSSNIEKIARDELGLIREGELIFQFEK